MRRLIRWWSTLWCLVESHQVEGRNAHGRDEAAVDRDHGAELRHFGEARDTAKSTRSQPLSHSLRPRPLRPHATENDGDGEDGKDQGKETGDIDPFLQDRRAMPRQTPGKPKRKRRALPRSVELEELPGNSSALLLNLAPWKQT